MPRSVIDLADPSLIDLIAEFVWDKSDELLASGESADFMLRDQPEFAGVDPRRLGLAQAAYVMLGRLPRGWRRTGRGSLLFLPGMVMGR